MRNTNFDIKYLQALEDPMDPNNSTGSDIASTVNGLIDLVGALDNVQDNWPAVDPDVVTATTHDPTYPYEAGSEVRLPYAFFRCIANVPAHSNIPLTDRNYWMLFYLPSARGAPYTGFYQTTHAYLTGHVAFRSTSTTLEVIQAKQDIPANTVFDSTMWHYIAIYDQGSDGWKGLYSELRVYNLGDVVIFEDRVYEAKRPLTPGPFNPDDWDLAFELDTTSIFMIKLFVQGITDDDELLYLDRGSVEFSLPAGLNGSIASSLVAAANNTSFDIYKNDDVVGSIDFTTGITDATFTFENDVVFTPADDFKIMQRGSSDRLLANVTITLQGNV